VGQGDLGRHLYESRRGAGAENDEAEQIDDLKGLVPGSGITGNPAAHVVSTGRQRIVDHSGDVNTFTDGDLLLGFVILVELFVLPEDPDPVGILEVESKDRVVQRATGLEHRVEPDLLTKFHVLDSFARFVDQP